MRRTVDLAHYQEPEPIAVGDTIDVISGIVMLLAIIAFGLGLVGVFG